MLPTVCSYIFVNVFVIIVVVLATFYLDANPVTFRRLINFGYGTCRRSVMNLCSLRLCHIADRCSGSEVCVSISNTRCDDCGICVPTSRASILGLGELFSSFPSLEYCPLILCAENQGLFMNVASLISSFRIFIRNFTNLSYGCRLFVFTTRLEIFDFVFTVFFFIWTRRLYHLGRLCWGRGF